MAEASTSSSSNNATVPFFKKKSRAAASTSTLPPPSRKRSASPTVESDEHSVIRGRKRQAYNPLKQGTAGITRRLREQEQDSAANDDEYYSDADNGEASSIAVKYADRGKSGMGYGLQDTATSRRDANGEMMLLNGDEALANTAGEGGGANAPDGLYHGAAKYQAQLPTGSAKYAPIKGPNANIKTITLVDYQVSALEAPECPYSLATD